MQILRIRRCARQATTLACVWLVELMLSNHHVIYLKCEIIERREKSREERKRESDNETISIKDWKEEEKIEKRSVKETRKVKWKNFAWVEIMLRKDQDERWIEWKSLRLVSMCELKIWDWVVSSEYFFIFIFLFLLDSTLNKNLCEMLYIDFDFALSQRLLLMFYLYFLRLIL